MADDAVKKLNGKNARNLARFAACMNMKLAISLRKSVDSLKNLIVAVSV